MWALYPISFLSSYIAVGTLEGALSRSGSPPNILSKQYTAT